MCTLALKAQTPAGKAARDTTITRPLYGNICFGIQAGVLLSVGARIRYLNSTETIPSWYADAEADVGFLSELRAGAGTFLT
jgi:hypothetical protein